QYEDVQGTQVPILNITLIGAGGRTIGQVSAIKVRSTYRQLPRNARYLLLYRDYADFDESTQKGIIRIYDLNYDGFLALEAELDGENITKLDTYSMPASIIAKYNFGGYGKQAPEHHYCDKNENGDVSWAECFNCLVESCNARLAC